MMTAYVLDEQNTLSIVSILITVICLSTFHQSVYCDDCIDKELSGCVTHSNLTERLGWVDSGANEVSTQSVGGVCDVWYIIGRRLDVITISFEQYDIYDNANCSTTYIGLGPAPCTRLCGLASLYPVSYISTGSVVRITYHHQGQAGGLGFRLKYVIGGVPSEDTSCSLAEFRCSNGKCIPSTWKCNGAVECEDETDETGCDKQEIPTIAPPDMYSCSGQFGGFGCYAQLDGRYRCFMTTRSCDGVKDCADGTDEKNCQCQRIFRDHYGVIASSSPSSFSPSSFNTSSSDCEYFIRVSPSRKVQIRFVTHPIGTATGNEENKMEIYDGVTTDSTRLLYRYSSRLPVDRSPVKILDATSDLVYIQTHISRGSTFFFNLTYQERGWCIPGQQHNCTGEMDCYDLSARCDGHWDCAVHGMDEAYCDSSCQSYQAYSCGLGHHLCYSEADRCNGKPRCTNSYADEHDCTASQCGHHNGTFLCSNSHCIREKWVCDGTNDCQDMSDEYHCPVSTRVVLSAVVGSISCSLIFVVTFGCLCRLHTLWRVRNGGSLASNGRSRHLSPITEIEEQIYAQMSAPPAYPEAMATSRPYEEVRQEELLRLATEEHGGRCSTARSTASSNLVVAAYPPPAYDAATTVTPLSDSDLATAGSVHCLGNSDHIIVDGISGSRNTVNSEENIIVGNHPGSNVECYDNEQLVLPLCSAFSVMNQSEPTLESRVELSLSRGLSQAQWCKVTSEDNEPLTSEQVRVSEPACCCDRDTSSLAHRREPTPRCWDSFGSDGDSGELASIDQSLATVEELETDDSTSSDTAMLLI